MSPLPFEQPSEEEKGHDEPAWPWQKTAEKKQTEDKLDKEAVKKKSQKEPEKQKPEPRKEEEPKEQPNVDQEKHEKRKTLVEQSIALVTKYEEEPIPRDAHTLARVMIAHQVIHLNQQLEHSDTIDQELSPKEIQAALDHIAELDAKFQEPTIESTPEIEASYQEIIKLAETTLQEVPDLESLVDSLNGADTDALATAAQSHSPAIATDNLQPETKATSGLDFSPGAKPVRGDSWRKGERDTRIDLTHPAVVAALVYAVAHIGRKKPKSNEKAAPTKTTDYAPSDSNVSVPSHPTSLSPPHSTPFHPSSNLTPFESRQAFSRPEHTIPTPRREHVAIPQRRSAPILAATAVAGTFAATRANREASPFQSHSRGERITMPTESVPYSIPTPESTPATSQRKIEHMPLLQLLSMAENVPLGHGRYLRREFEAGAIDKEGLIKILKAQSKGRDYQWEFRQQSARFSKLKATSPEFLHTRQPQDDVKTELPHDNTSHEAPAEPGRKERNPEAPLSLAPPTDHLLLPHFAQNTPKPHTTQQILLITTAFIAGFIVIGALAVGIFIWLR